MYYNSDGLVAVVVLGALVLACWKFWIKQKFFQTTFVLFCWIFMAIFHFCLSVYDTAMPHNEMPWRTYVVFVVLVGFLGVGIVRDRQLEN